MWRLVLRRLVPRGYAWAIRTWLLATPGVATLYLWLNPMLRHRRVTSETTLAIDGFPRSANGYVSYALEMLLPESARVSALTHAPQTVRAAARLGRPCLLLVRQPDAVVSSILTYDPRQTPAAVFTAYALYYEAVASVRDRVVVTDFDEVTNDLPGVISRLDERYGLGIPPDAVASLQPEDVFARLDRAAAAMVEREEISPERLRSRISRPVAGREQFDLSEPGSRWARPRDRAWRAYRALVDETLNRQ